MAHLELRPAPKRREKKTLKERAFEKIDVSKELKKLYYMLEELKVNYEQFFMGMTPFQPDKLHREVRMLIRRIRKAPFKKPPQRYRLRSIESRYHTYNDYWQRVLRQKEEGTYSKDVFRAQIREQNSLEDEQAQTASGAASKALTNLYKSYRRALEQTTGRKQEIDFDRFKKQLMQRAKAERKRLGGEKLSFKVVVKNGKVLVQARIKEKKQAATS